MPRAGAAQAPRLDEASGVTLLPEALTASPTHRANILHPDYTQLGVGVAVADDGRVIYTQLFKTAW